MPSLAATVIGALLVAMLGQFLALLCAGAGEGWVQPMQFSFAIWVLLPWVAVRYHLRQRGEPLGIKADLALLALSVIVDIFLVLATVSDGLAYFQLTMTFLSLPALFWILIWLSWQAVVAWWVIDHFFLGGGPSPEGY